MHSTNIKLGLEFSNMIQKEILFVGISIEKDSPLPLGMFSKI